MILAICQICWFRTCLHRVVVTIVDGEDVLFTLEVAAALGHPGAVHDIWQAAQVRDLDSELCCKLLQGILANAEPFGREGAHCLPVGSVVHAAAFKLKKKTLPMSLGSVIQRTNLLLHFVPENQCGNRFLGGR